MVVGRTYTIKSENVRLAVFDRCVSQLDEPLRAFIFDLGNGEYAFAIPSSLDELFLGTKGDRFENYPFPLKKSILDLLPQPVGKYADIDGDNYVILHERALDYLILDYANRQLGKYFTASRMSEAAQQLYEKQERDASYFGINASSKFLIRLGPFLYLVLTFELWRRVRRLPVRKLQSQKYWFVFETRDVVGRAYGYLCAVLPVLFCLAVYGFFAISQSLGLIVFDRVLTITGLLTLTFPLSPGPGWMQTDWLAVLLAVILVPLQLLISALISMRLCRVVSANLRGR